MRNKLSQFAIIIFLFFTSQAYAVTVTNINFIGLNNTSESNLLEVLMFKTGQELLPEDSDKIIDSLFKTGYFSDITLVQNGSSLNITLKENPYIKNFNISSKSSSSWKDWVNSRDALFSDSELQGLVNQSKIKAGEIFTEQKLLEFQSFVKNKYIEAGFYNTIIETSNELDVQNRIGIDFQISQGNRAKIEVLEIIGASHFTKKELLRLFDIGEASFSFINYFTNKDNFSATKLQQGLDLVTQKYFNSGYLDFNILNVSTDLKENNEKIFIEITISEGIQYKLGSISFEGELGSLSADDLASALSIQSGDVFDRSIIMNDIQEITDIYADQGYAFIDVIPVTRDLIDKVNVNIEISLNQKIYINRITISGNTRTQDSVIRREINVSEGGLYSRSNLRKSIGKLRRLGYFSDVQMVATEVEGVSNKINLNFLVEETKTGAISLSLSHSNSYGISIGAGIKEKNIFGSGNTLNAELKLSDSFNKVSAFFENPNFNDKQHSVNFGGYISEINDDDVMQDSYEINTKGLSFGYGIPLSEDTRINSNIEYSKNKIKCGASFSVVGYELTQCSQPNNDTVSINSSWSENTLNDYLYPTEGKSNSASINIATPIGDYRFISLNANHSSYQPFNNNVTLKLTGDISIAKGYNGKELPFFKRYFGGGSGSVRGFGNKTLGPLYPNGKAKGGELSVFGSANLITPAFFFDNNDNMRLSAFIDAGNIFEKSSNVNLGNLRMSTGIGFAYLSPIGAIGAYISTPILKKSGDIIENFGLSLGTGF